MPCDYYEHMTRCHDALSQHLKAGEPQAIVRTALVRATRCRVHPPAILVGSMLYPSCAETASFLTRRWMLQLQSACHLRAAVRLDNGFSGEIALSPFSRHHFLSPIPFLSPSFSPQHRFHSPSISFLIRSSPHLLLSPSFSLPIPSIPLPFLSPIPSSPPSLPLPRPFLSPPLSQRSGTPVSGRTTG